jgi:hypothetical protein
MGRWSGGVCRDVGSVGVMTLVERVMVTQPKEKRAAKRIKKNETREKRAGFFMACRHFLRYHLVDGLM